MPRQKVGGLYKRCDCGRRKWLKCPHAYHFDFYRGRKYRFSLDKIAQKRGIKPPRTKGDAESLRDLIRSEIRAGTFRDPNRPELPPAPDPNALLTVDDVIEQYITRHVKVPTRRETAQKTMLWHLGVISRTEIPAAHGQRVRFGHKAIKEVTKADVEAIREARRRAPQEAVAALRQWEVEAAERAKRGEAMNRPRPRLLYPGNQTAGEVGINRLLERLRHLFAWAIEEGYVDGTPFKRHGQVVVRLTKEQPRERRLNDSADERQAGEEERLLQHASPHLRDLIIAGIATGCRVGELLGLQWKDVRTATGPRGHTRRFLVLPAAKTKTNTTREVPIGSKLAAVLEMRRHGPNGKPHSPDRYVFGDEVGERIKTVKKAWQTAVLKAHGQKPQWVKGKRNQLAPESLVAYRQINLQFRDLRREFGSRVLESGSTPLDARDLLGHADIRQTSTYLRSTMKGLASAIDRKEEYERQRAARVESDDCDLPLATSSGTSEEVAKH